MSEVKTYEIRQLARRGFPVGDASRRARMSEAVRQVNGLFEGLLSEAFTEPPPVLPQMPKSTEFGGGECSVGMKTLIFAQVEIVSPLFSSRWFLRGANGGG
jgi:hypothetical protein